MVFVCCTWSCGTHAMYIIMTITMLLGVQQSFAEQVMHVHVQYHVYISVRQGPGTNY
jgi:hypothetical protein